jgi:hypothetical protein
MVETIIAILDLINALLKDRKVSTIQKQRKEILREERR